jgi:hypothetical protein
MTERSVAAQERIHRGWGGSRFILAWLAVILLARKEFFDESFSGKDFGEGFHDLVQKCKVGFLAMHIS